MPTGRLARVFGPWLFFLLLAAPAATLAQQMPQTPQENSQQDQEPVTTLKVQVNLVNLFFNVKDKHGLLIPHLTKDDFQVFEDGKPQTIKFFAAESNEPLTLGILIDTSYSQNRVLPMEKEVGADFLSHVLTPKDLAFVINFDVNVTLLQDFTNNQRELRAALDSTKINAGGMGGGIPGMGQGPFPTQGTPKGTLLFDAVYLASQDKLASEVGRKAMILLTDGEDQGSQTRIKEAIEAAQKADAICYVLLIADRGFYFGQGMGYTGEGDMRQMAEQTGGRVINVGNKYEKLKQAFDEISNELRSQYNIGYTSTNAARDGTFRKIEIKSKQDYKIQARRGYYAPLPQ
ncbi:MAG TPA: VWA domain-containing protein [Terriglobales bacterium]|nr:VWA domain-containing protein [Terriglobales bacterium]